MTAETATTHNNPMYIILTDILRGGKTLKAAHDLMLRAFDQRHDEINSAVKLVEAERSALSAKYSTTPGWMLTSQARNLRDAIYPCVALNAKAERVWRKAHARYMRRIQKFGEGD